MYVVQCALWGCVIDIRIVSHSKSKQTKANLKTKKKNWLKNSKRWVSVLNFQHICKNRLKNRILNQTMTNRTGQDSLQLLAGVQNQRRIIQVNNFQKVSIQNILRHLIFVNHPSYFFSKVRFLVTFFCPKQPTSESGIEKWL